MSTDNAQDATQNLTDLRTHLFATLAALRDPAAPMDIARARAISEVARTVIDTAKVEVDYLRVSGGGESSFIDTGVGDANLPTGITGRTVHRLK